MMHYDVAIAGGAIVGSSTAYYLRKQGFTGTIAVFEPDPAYARACTTLSWGGIRRQFSNPENIRLSGFGLDLIRNLKSEFGPDADIGFKERGYLVMASEASVSILEENMALQRSMGAETIMLEGAELAQKFPYINFEGIAAASFGVSGEGWFDPYGLLSLIRKAAQARDVTYVPHAVTALDTDGSRIRALMLDDGAGITVGAFVNAAGANAGAIAAMAGIDLPVSAAKRYAYVVQCNDTAETMRNGCMHFDISGFHWRPESQGFLWGCTPTDQDEPSVKDWDVDYAWFEEHVWPLAANRVPAFEAVKLSTAWVGHYDYNWFDQNGVIGVHPTIENFYFGNGFSGHGIQQGPATGNAIAELICHGEYRNMDLRRMGYERILRKEPLFEKNIF
jgi:FAD-dependent oxidoreductase domain-containing protein 1